MLTDDFATLPTCLNLGGHYTMRGDKLIALMVQEVWPGIDRDDPKWADCALIIQRTLRTLYSAASIEYDAWKAQIATELHKRRAATR